MTLHCTTLTIACSQGLHLYAHKAISSYTVFAAPLAPLLIGPEDIYWSEDCFCGSQAVETIMCLVRDFVVPVGTQAKLPSAEHTLATTAQVYAIGHPNSTMVFVRGLSLSTLNVSANVQSSVDTFKTLLEVQLHLEVRHLSLSCWCEDHPDLVKHCRSEVLSPVATGI